MSVPDILRTVESKRCDLKLVSFGTFHADPRSLDTGAVLRIYRRNSNLLSKGTLPFEQFTATHKRRVPYCPQCHQYPSNFYDILRFWHLRRLKRRSLFNGASASLRTRGQSEKVWRTERLNGFQTQRHCDPYCCPCRLDWRVITTIDCPRVFDYVGLNNTSLTRPSATPHACSQQSLAWKGMSRYSPLSKQNKKKEEKNFGTELTAS